mgnify:CR=1 FL=1
MAYKYPKALILDAIEGSDGCYSSVAQRLGCSRNTARRYVGLWKETRAAFEEAAEVTLDEFESILRRLARANNLRALEFYMNAKGKSRGYGRQLFEGTFDGRVEFELTMREPDETDDEDDYGAE